MSDTTKALMRRYIAMTAYQQAFVADFLVTQVPDEVIEQALRYGQIVEDFKWQNKNW